MERSGWTIPVCDCVDSSSQGLHIPRHALGGECQASPHPSAKEGSSVAWVQGGTKQLLLALHHRSDTLEVFPLIYWVLIRFCNKQVTTLDWCPSVKSIPECTR